MDICSASRSPARRPLSVLIKEHDPPPLPALPAWVRLPPAGSVGEDGAAALSTSSGRKEVIKSAE